MHTAGWSPLRSTRRLLAALLLLVGAACGTQPGDAGLGEQQQGLTGTRVRVMAANLSSGNNQAYEDPGIRIFQGVKPDVALVQECNYKTSSQADLDAFAQAAFGPGVSSFREPGSLQIPNCVFSRYPIVASGSWDDPSVTNRDFAWAKIRMPDGKFLWAFSLHLLTNTSAHDAEGKALVAAIKANVPAADYIVIGGDFNSGSRSDAAVAALSQVVQTAGPYPADGAGNQNTNAGRTKPYDWLLADPDLDPLAVPVVIGGQSFASGLVVDTRVYAPLADLAPAQSGDSGATNMQHMAVVRDFMIPAGGPVATVTVTSPNGGESWVAGTSHAIAWTAANFTSAKVEWTADGSAWTTLAASVAASAGTFAWTVPATATATAKVRVSDAAGGGASDVSDAAFTITVPAPPAGDGFEPDDTAAQAKPITLGVPQLHDLSPKTDADWVTFTLTATTNVRIETSGPSGGDTFLRLYNASGTTQLAQDDDSGVGYYSLIQKTGLAAGTYTVKVTSYNNATTIKGYTLKVSSY